MSVWTLCLDILIFPCWYLRKLSERIALLWPFHLKASTGQPWFPSLCLDLISGTAYVPYSERGRKPRSVAKSGGGLHYSATPVKPTYDLRDSHPALTSRPSLMACSHLSHQRIPISSHNAFPHTLFFFFFFFLPWFVSALFSIHQTFLLERFRIQLLISPTATSHLDRGDSLLTGLIVSTLAPNSTHYTRIEEIIAKQKSLYHSWNLWWLPAY